jgi:hypothetical protein
LEPKTPRSRIVNSPSLAVSPVIGSTRIISPSTSSTIARVPCWWYADGLRLTWT